MKYFDDECQKHVLRQQWKDAFGNQNGNTARNNEQEQIAEHSYQTPFSGFMMCFEFNRQYFDEEFSGKMKIRSVLLDNHISEWIISAGIPPGTKTAIAIFTIRLYIGFSSSVSKMAFKINSRYFDETWIRLAAIIDLVPKFQKHLLPKVEIRKGIPVVFQGRAESDWQACGTAKKE